MHDTDHHGGFDAGLFDSLGVPYDAARDFSVNINPWGPAAQVRHAVATAEIAAYPDPRNLPLRRALAARLGTVAERLVVDAGSCRLLWSMMRHFGGPGQTVVVVEPTFGEAARAARACGARVEVVRRSDPAAATTARRWAVDVHVIAAHAHAVGAAIVYLCDPNNPTGELLPPGAIDELASELPPSTLLIMDQAYRWLTRAPAPSIARTHSNVALLQSMTKEQGVPGLRMGYVELNEERAAVLTSQRPSWCCGAAESGAMIAALDARPELDRILSAWFSEVDALAAALRDQGWQVELNDCPWVLVRGVAPGRLKLNLLRKGNVLVRDCTSFGIADALRISPRLPAMNRLLIDAFSALRPEDFASLSSAEFAQRAPDD